MPSALSGFNVTYEIITDESAEQGDFAETGFLTRDGDHIDIEKYMALSNAGNADHIPLDMTLREAIDMLIDHLEGPIEADEFPVMNPSWFRLYNEEWDSATEPRELETRSLHLPDWVSQGSRMRIARYLGVRGVK